MLLRQLYTNNSLKNTAGGVQFALKNRLSDGEFSELTAIKIDGREVPPAQISVDLGDGQFVAAESVRDVAFPLRKVLNVRCDVGNLETGKHKIGIAFKAKPFGSLKFEVEDSIAETESLDVRIPRDTQDDYSENAIRARQDFVEQYTGAKLEHIRHYSFDPHTTAGNCENFTGVAQIPIGFAGPLKVNGEYANGDFLIPLATTEGTLIASYNRGIKVLNLSGGVKSTVVSDAMQRAPVFVFEDAREGRKFVGWILSNIEKIKEEAEATSSVAKLKYIDPYTANKFVYLR
jgi:hydroxymethylglutaryl-CoA reductase (NADPH)